MWHILSAPLSGTKPSQHAEVVDNGLERDKTRVLGGSMRFFSPSQAIAVSLAALSTLAPQARANVRSLAAHTAQDDAVRIAAAGDDCASLDVSALPPSFEARGVPTGEIRRAHTTMGSTIALGVSGVACDVATAAFAEVFAEYSRVESLVATDGEHGLGAVNRAAGRDPVVVDPELFALVELALDFARETRGAFDPTFAALDGVWKFPKAGETREVPAGETRVPDVATVDSLRRLVDYKKVVLDGDARSVFLPESGMRLSLGGIAMGYATDNAVRLLRRRGVAHFIVRTSSEIYISGDPGGGARKLAIPGTDGNAPIARVPLDEAALNISRDSDRFFEEGGVRYHHIIDPRTGFPAHHVRQVALIARDAATADALSTGIFVLGPREGLALVERWAGVDAIIIDSEGRVWVSSGVDGVELMGTRRR
jgi:thiamine biosynthesis lipoprotein